MNGNLSSIRRETSDWQTLARLAFCYLPRSMIRVLESLGILPKPSQLVGDPGQRSFVLQPPWSLHELVLLALRKALGPASSGCSGLRSKCGPPHKPKAAGRFSTRAGMLQGPAPTSQCWSSQCSHSQCCANITIYLVPKHFHHFQRGFHAH